MTSFIVDDGGRAEAGFKGKAGDCVTRSIAIAAEMPYRAVYDALSKGVREQRTTKGGVKRVSARDGVFTQRKWFKNYMATLEFQWVPLMTIGSGCQVHLNANELPAGRLVISVSRHYTAMIDGVIHDTDDPRRDGKRCVYGYWHKPN